MELQTLFTDAGFSVNMPVGNVSDPARLAANASFANAFTGLDVNPVTRVPEPSTLVLTGGALGMLALVIHRKDAS